MLLPPAPSSLMQLDTQRPIISRNSWLKYGCSNCYGQGVSIHPIVVPKIVAEPSMPVQPGYQEVHKIYDEMGQFFTQKAMSVHGSEIVVVKVTIPTSPSHGLFSR